jgi:hypothetical protein
MTQLTREDLLELSKALTSAREAMAEHRFAEANDQIKIAEKHAKTDELTAMVDRLWQINDMARQFRDSVAAAIQELQIGDDFKVGTSTQVVVVETEADSITVRLPGARPRAYRIAQLPIGLSMALVDMKLDPADPTNRVIKGAYVLSAKEVDPDNVEKAKTWWEEAQLNGVDVSKLMPFLQDKYDFKKELAAMDKEAAKDDK